MRLILFFCALCVSGTLLAQSGCPDCVTQVPENLTEDTIFIGTAATGTVGSYYESDVSFRFPKTTTPVADISENIPGGLDINEITIVSVSNVPPGLNWEPNQLSFRVQELTDGCVRFCGTPLVAGTYEVEVVVEARILVLNETTSVTIPITIEPQSSVTEGFALSQVSACGALDVEITNLVPSNGKPGFQYHWDFGDGRQSENEKPATIRYDRPGSYPINYEAIIDTTGFFLTQVRINSVTCGDLFGGRADLKFRVFDPGDEEIYASVVTENTPLPWVVDLTVPLNEGNYRLFIEDEDSGLGGGDDNCGTINFTQLNGGTFIEGGLEVELNIIHPVDTVRSTEVVTIFEIPSQPTLVPDRPYELCTSDSATLMVENFSTGLQWYRDSFPLPLEEDQTQLRISDTASYYVVHTADNGCRSEAVFPQATLLPEPGPLVLKTLNNVVELAENSVLPEVSRFRWYVDGTLIEGETTTALCVSQSGDYQLEVTDLVSGCIGTATSTVQFNPNIACSVNTEEVLAQADLRLFPNPANEHIQLTGYFAKRQPLQLSLFNSMGQLIRQDPQQQLIGNWTERFELADLPHGHYVLRLQSDREVRLLPFVH